MEIANDVTKYCGVALNGVLFILLVTGLARSPKQRRLPRIWLLMGLIMSNWLTPTFVLLLNHFVHSDVVTSNHHLCVLITNLPACFDAISVLASALLGCHVFLWVYAPTAEKGRRTFLFWVIAEFVTWAVCIAVTLAIRAPDTEVLVIDQSLYTTAKKFCMVNFEKGSKNVIFSCLFLVLPFIFALPIGCLSLWINAGNKRQNATEMVPLPVTSQTNPEYFGLDSTKPDVDIQNEGLQASADQSRGPILLQWVLFSLVNVIAGFGLRVLGHLLLQHFFTEAVIGSGNYFKIWHVSVLCHMIYFCVVPVLCMILPETRKTLSCFCNACKK